jgi:hypothetical protein
MRGHAVLVLRKQQHRVRCIDGGEHGAGAAADAAAPYQ